MVVKGGNTCTQHTLSYVCIDFL